MSKACERPDLCRRELTALDALGANVDSALRRVEALQGDVDAQSHGLEEVRAALASAGTAAAAHAAEVPLAACAVKT